MHMLSERMCSLVNALLFIISLSITGEFSGGGGEKKMGGFLDVEYTCIFYLEQCGHVCSNYFWREVKTMSQCLG